MSQKRFLRNTSFATAFLFGLASLLPLGMTARADDARKYQQYDPSPKLQYTTDWLGNSFSGATEHVQSWITNSCVAPDGTVLTTSNWDEGFEEVSAYKSGHQTGALEATHTSVDGTAVATNGQYVWATTNTNMLKSGVVATMASRKVVNLPSSAVASGLAANDTALYVSDKANNQILVLDAETGAQQGSFPVQRPGRLALDKNGNLWVLQSSNENGSYAIAEYRPDGTQVTANTITFASAVVPTALAFNPKTGQLMVADDGIDQNVKLYDTAHLSGIPTAVADTFGTQYGINSGTPGVNAPLKFHDLVGVGADADGNLYVTFGKQDYAWSEIQAYSADGNQLWDVYGNQFVASAAPDPTDDGVFYTPDGKFTKDYTKGSGQGWTYDAYTLNKFKYPDDPRIHTAVESPVIRVIDGQKFMFASEQYGNTLAIYRFDEETDGETAIPCGYISSMGIFTAPEPDFDYFTVNGSRHEGEAYTALSPGLRIDYMSNASGGQAIGAATNGAYMEYDNLDFGDGATSITASVACTGDSGTLEVRLGSTTGPVIGTIAAPNTGDWNTFAEVTAAITSTSGMQNVFFVYRQKATGAEYPAAGIAPDTGEFMWIDTNGDGQIQKSEILTNPGNTDSNGIGQNAPTSWDWDVDSNGNIWRGSEGDAGIRELKLQDINDKGVPEYAYNVSETMPPNDAQSDIDYFEIGSTKIEAESANPLYGGGVGDSDANSGEHHIGWLHSGNAAEYDGVDFGAGTGSFSISSASGNKGNSVELYIDATREDNGDIVGGTLIGTADLPDTGSWQTFQTTTISITPTNGTHNLLLVFREVPIYAEVIEPAPTLLSADGSDTDANGDQEKWTSIERTYYVPATDTMFIAGYSADNPKNPLGFGLVGQVIVRYDHWSDPAQRTQAWRIDLDGTVGYLSQDKSWDIAGNYLFLAFGYDGRIQVYDTSNGKLVGHMYAGPEVGGSAKTGWLDTPYAISARQLQDGSYVVTEEDDLYSKQVVYLWSGDTTPDPTGDEPLPAFPADVSLYKTTQPISVNAKFAESDWNSALSIPVATNTGGQDNNVVKFGALYDDDYLYLGATVKDACLNDTSDQQWNDDAMEFFIDGNDDKSGPYDQYDQQVIFGWNFDQDKLYTSGWSNDQRQQVKRAWYQTNDGYNIELAIPWSVIGVTPQPGGKIGLDAANDENADGSVRAGGLVAHGDGSEYNSNVNYLNFVFSGAAPQPSSDATLSGLTMDGAPVNGFDANTADYSVVLPAGTMAIPTVAATPNDAGAHAVVTQAAVLPGTATVAVTAADGTATKTYTIRFTVAAPSGGGTTTPIDVTVTGTTIGNGAAAATTATIPADRTDPAAVANVTVDLGNVTVSAPASILNAAFDGDFASSLQLSQAASPDLTQSLAIAAATAAGTNALTVLDINLTRITADGTSTALHQLGGNAGVTIHLTAAELASVTDTAHAHLYYYDPANGTLTDMHATFDLAAGTATFSTDHFSTYVLAVDKPAATAPIGVSYSAHVQKLGWLASVLDGALGGTTGRSLRAEAVKLSLTGTLPEGAKLTYQAHVQKLGWLPAVSNGAVAGTTGKALRLEALRVTLSGLPGYAVQYRVHVQSKGWLAWQTAANGTDISKAAVAGTTGQSLRLEAVEVRLVKVS